MNANWAGFVRGKLRGALLAGLLVAVSCLAPSAAWAQKSEQSPPSESLTPAQPKDITTRAKAHTELGSLYFQNGNLIVALEELTLAIAINPDYAPAYALRGVVLYHIKEFASADSDFQKALSLNAKDPEINNNYGWYLCETGKERQSIVYFLNALKSPLYETPDRAYTNAGTCALKAGDLEGAQNYLLKALQLSRDGAMPARMELAKLFYRRGILEESRIYLNDALKMMEPPSAEALWLGVRIERKLGNRAAEGGFASQLRSRYPSSMEYQEFLKGNFE